MIIDDLEKLDFITNKARTLLQYYQQQFTSEEYGAALSQLECERSYYLKKIKIGYKL